MLFFSSYEAVRFFWILIDKKDLYGVGFALFNFARIRGDFRKGESGASGIMDILQFGTTKTTSGGRIKLRKDAKRDVVEAFRDVT